jgi:hypothetical protein
VKCGILGPRPVWRIGNEVPIGLPTSSKTRPPTRPVCSRIGRAAIKPGRCALLAGLGLAVVASFLLVAPAGAATDPETALAEKYAPVVRLVAQPEPCGDGEPYEPADVEAVLGNAEVVLRGPWDTVNVAKIAPTARDLEPGLIGYHLDLPFNALAPGCNYEQWARRVTRRFAPTTYARVAGDSDHPGRLALQYWFFYAFNDYNDKHEGDWEMIQLDFDAPDAAAALKTTPTVVGYSQHEGAEQASWGSSKLKLVGGTHPVVYPAAGSHANYYDTALYLGRSAAQGVGCDDTVGPSRQLRPRVAVTPTDRTDYLAAYPWLGFEGRWGEKHPGFYDGPTGPNTKAQWEHPITWTETSWREESFAIPSGGSAGNAVADVFCGAVAKGSNLLTVIVRNPWPALLVIGAIVSLGFWLGSKTRWDVSTPFRVRRRRPLGSIVTTSGRLYARRPRLFLGVGLLFLPLGLVITLIQYLIFRVGPLAPLTDTVGGSNAFVAGLALTFGTVLTILGLSVVQAATAHALVELDEGREIGSLRAFRLGLNQIPPLLGALARATVLTAVLTVTVVGIPLAVWLIVRWSLIAQVVALEDHRARGALRRSGTLVTRHWLRTASITYVVAALSLLLGPVIGAILLLITSASFNVINLAASGIYVVTMPFVAITTTYLYFDLLVREKLGSKPVERAAVLPAEI